jgi:plasmid maintenance system killer protein
LDKPMAVVQSAFGQRNYHSSLQIPSLVYSARFEFVRGQRNYHHSIRLAQAWSMRFATITIHPEFQT